MTDRTIIRGGYILTMDDEHGDFGCGDILIDDGLIVSISDDADASDAKVIDASGCIVTPGFVDTHRHLWQTFLRGAVPNCTLPTYMRDILGKAGSQVTPEDGYIGTLLGAVECLNAGITTVLDWSHALATSEDSDARVAALLESGIRAFYAPNTPASPEWYSWDVPRTHPEDIRRLRNEQFSSNDGLVRLAAGLRSPGQVPDSVVQADWALARELELLISIHAGTRGARGGMHEVDALERLGLLGSDVHFAHGNEFSDKELELVAEASAGIAMSPYAEMSTGLGTVRPARLLSHGIKAGLSADGTSMAPGDMFSEMQIAFLCGRAEQLPADPTELYEPTFAIRDVLALATMSGARSIGLGDVCGSLTVGKSADIVLTRADAVNTAPVSDPVATVVMSANTANVDTVLVGGKLVKHQGQLVDVDVRSLVSRARQSRDRVLGAANLPTVLGV